MPEKKRTVRIGSRASRLAVLQSEIVMAQIESACPGIRTELVTMKTTGDKILDRTLDQIGGKGLFVKELDESLRNGEVDITVHSLKDLPIQTPENLPVLAFSVREDPRDVLVLPGGAADIDRSLPIGTSSLRRSLQIKELMPGVSTAPVRGNVETRLRKLDEGHYSALILAAAGLKRLGLEHRISRYFEIDEMIPAACQGILAIQGRASDDNGYLFGVTDRDSMYCALAERAYIKRIGADCGSPDTAYAETVTSQNGTVMLIKALRYDPEDGMVIRKSISGSVYEAAALGTELAEKMLNNG